MKYEQGILFYRIGTPLSPYEKPVFYGYTFDATMAKEFRHYRNMKYFLEKPVEMSAEEKTGFEKRFRKYVIHPTTFETRTENELGRRKTDVTLPCTMIEEEVVFTKIDQVFYEIGKQINFYPLLQIGSSKMKKLLTKAKVRAFYQFATACWQENMNPDERLFAGETSVDIMEDMDVRVDPFGVFLYLYGDTMRDDF